MSTSVVTQRQTVAFSAPLTVLQYYLSQLSTDVASFKLTSGKDCLRIFDAITIVKEPNMLVIEVNIFVHKI